MVAVDLLTAGAIGAIILLIYHWIATKYEYFLTKPVPCVKPTFGFGSSAPTLFRRTDVSSLVTELYYAFPDSKVSGFYDFIQPVYLLRDLEMIKKIAVKDFDYFTDHALAVSFPEDESDGGGLFGNSLFSLRGQKWRDMRATLSPAFTGSKMRHMFELVAECGRSMVQFLTSEVQAGKTLEYEMKDMFSRFGNDVIATVAFGIKVDSLRERQNEFYEKGKQMLNFQSIGMVVRVLLLTIMPGLMQKLKVDLVDANLTGYFKNMITDNMKQREAHGIVRNDMIQMLMEVQKGALKHQKDEKQTKDAGFATVEESHIGKSTHSRVWTENELIAQCFLFFLAGFDTVSTCMTFLTYELIVNPNVQKRLYEEVVKTDESLNGKPLTYDALQKMQYMDMVVSETLRLWPPAVVFDRLCVKDYRYDDGNGTRFTIEKGQMLMIPTIAIHRDPKYYPNPEKFDPERFSEENRSSINTGAYLPFGAGPRNCIGSRLALMEVKSILYYLLKDFSLERTEKTQIPLQLQKNMFVLQAEKGVWLELKPRK
ncbi:probable cytochrome P450 9f2 [Toxorhynchites rutilus septentrionalis]|uniref:probable cytochrome P450 9f2 n=1 Tax=Toxorhynchites rutilus septentrionalis TaxID=329112 RepID=UPI002478E32C|nr:probable cytochrome P450 9f2 [Toxorhynchites rutilus septentrionalis]XP_055619249.1 probable cytochrome P450 9f2 [Toxorhynchites rutilus septentrionalis]